MDNFCSFISQGLFAGDSGLNTRMYTHDCVLSTVISLHMGVLTAAVTTPLCVGACACVCVCVFGSLKAPSEGDSAAARYQPWPAAQR